MGTNYCRMKQNKTQCELGNGNCKLLFCFSAKILTQTKKKSIKWKQYISLYEVFEQISFYQEMSPARYIVHPKVNICISETIITLVYSQLVLGFLFMVPERSIWCDSLLECFVLLYARSRREYGTPNGSTAFLLSAFVLEGFLASQPQNTQALLLLPEGKTVKRTQVNCLIEQQPACTASRWAQYNMFHHSTVGGGAKKTYETYLFSVVHSLFICVMKGGLDLRFVYQEDKSFTHNPPQMWGGGG